MIKYDISKFPPELIAQLKRKDLSRGMEYKLLNIFESATKPLTVDDIIIEMFSRYETICKRTTLSTVLSHLYRAGLIRRICTGLYAAVDSQSKEEGNG